MQQNLSPVVRAIDVGYGHVKWTEGRDINGSIVADSYPSQAPVAVASEFTSEVMQRRDTHIVPVDSRRFEVGRDISMAIGKNQELEQLDDKFALSDEYTARLYGAFNYMLPSLPSREIDFLMLGLPLTTLELHSAELSERFSGKHVINVRGDTVTVNYCAVYPQPMGGYAAYLERPTLHHDCVPRALIVDVGYNTVDWITCQGMVTNPHQQSAVERGMNAYLREVAKSVIKASGVAAGESAVVRMLDKSLMSGKDFRLTGRKIDILPHLEAGHSVLEQAAQAVRNHVGVGEAIDVVIVVGGGAETYAPWIRKQFPTHEVATIDEPALAVVRGFHQLGEWVAASAQRAKSTDKRSSVATIL